ncbi:hypothetical protein [Ensifer sp. Root127]|uniref:hypothetical protein n=1 Tax=Ensifer sp. Root127 TaxID=1736440 RepID=UPI00070BCE40|nr:hypothetical protein [Ensifer sp. Root127]KQW72374.1 hypothetical protein ASD03_31955 [Ensifer sp. Root127]
MVENDGNPHQEPVQVRIRSIASFIGILEKEGLKDAFFSGAPSVGVLPGGSGDTTTMTRLDTELFRGREEVSPMDLSTMIDRYLSEKADDLDDTRLTIAPETMAYAVQFVESRGLAATYPLAAHLRNCKGGPVECPEGI